jgi:hypothetical protein
MKRRYIYSVLVGMPGLIVSLIVSVFVFGAVAGMLWLFVFGDNPWPAFVETSLPIFFAAVFLTVWLGTVAAGYFIGKRRERDAALNKAHVLLSVGATVLCISAILLYQLGVGNSRLR